MKNILLAICIAAIAACAFAEPSEPTETAFLPPWAHIYGETQLGTAYQQYGVVYNDELSWIYQGTVEFDLPERFGTVGGGAWVLSDLTSRCGEYNSKWNKETDLEVHYSNSYEVVDDWELKFGLTYIWFNFYHCRGGNPETQRSLVFPFALENPHLTPFLNVEYQHAYSEGVMLEWGVRREFYPLKEIPLSVIPSVFFTSGSDGFYESLLPSTSDGDGYDKFSLGSAFVRLRANYALFNHFAVWVQATYIAAIDRELRSAMDDGGGTCHKDIAMAEIGVSVAF